MRPFPFLTILIGVGFTASLTAGPETFDPLEAYKKANTLSSRPKSETVTQGTNTETARFKYENGLLVRADYLNQKNIPTGYSLYEYDKGVLAREQLFDAGGNLTEDISYHYKGARLEKSLIHDIRGSARIEWHYGYDKDGKLVSGKRILDKKQTESFKLVPSPAGMTQHIYNAKGELTGKIESVVENGLLRQRVKTGLTGARYAEYRYNQKQQLVEIIYHETVRGEKTFVKKHLFDYSLAAESGAPTARHGGRESAAGTMPSSPPTALRTGN